jgi:hypothetical protein
MFAFYFGLYDKNEPCPLPHGESVGLAKEGRKQAIRVITVFLAVRPSAIDELISPPVMAWFGAASRSNTDFSLLLSLVPKGSRHPARNAPKNPFIKEKNVILGIFNP